MCDKCEGTGVVFNPAWEKFLDWNASHPQSPERDRWSWVIERAYFGGDPPPQFVACECRAAGTLSEERKAA
jgi:hypothetical protein